MFKVLFAFKHKVIFIKQRPKNTKKVFLALSVTFLLSFTLFNNVFKNEQKYQEQLLPLKIND